MHYFLDIEGERVDLKGSTVELGRASPIVNALQSQSVSRRHALLWQVPGQGWWLKNLSDSNKLEVNQEPVAAEGRSLKSGDVIRLGGAVVCRYYFDVEATFPGDEPTRKKSPLSTLTLGIAQSRPKREISTRIEVLEEHIDGILERLDTNEAMDNRTRSTLERVALELRRSGDRLDQVAEQNRSHMGLACGALAISLFTALAVGVIRDTQKTQDFLAAIYDEVGSPEGAASLVIAVGSSVISWKRWQREQTEKKQGSRSERTPEPQGHSLDASVPYYPHPRESSHVGQPVDFNSHDDSHHLYQDRRSEQSRHRVSRTRM